MSMQTEIENSIKILSEGGNFMYPTDTIWGIGCDATNPEAVKKIFELKGREDTKAMLILVDSVRMLEEYVDEIPAAALKILEITDQPLTIVYPGARGLALNLLHSDGSAGIRITIDPFCNNLVHAFGKPIVSSSANAAGETAPAFFSQIQTELLQSVNYVVDWRRKEKNMGKPSGILKIGLNGEIEVIRE